MIKVDLLRLASKYSGLPQTEINEALRGLRLAIQEALANPDNGKITIPGIGTFRTKQTADHIGMNPNTREPIEVKGKKKVTFKVSETLDRALNG